MPSQKTLTNLKTHCTTILKKADTLGLTNVRVFKSPLASGEDKFCCIVDAKPEKAEEISYFESGQFTDYLEKKLKCSVSVEFADELDSGFKKDILKNAVELSTDNLTKITQLFFPAKTTSASSEKNANHRHRYSFHAPENGKTPLGSGLQIHRNGQQLKRTHVNDVKEHIDAKGNLKKPKNGITSSVPYSQPTFTGK
jgi:predicted nucleotidyltransferase